MDDVTKDKREQLSAICARGIRTSIASADAITQAASAIILDFPGSISESRFLVARDLLVGRFESAIDALENLAAEIRKVTP